MLTYADEQVWGDKVGAPLSSTVTRWNQNAFVRGAYSYMAVDGGGPDDVQEVRKLLALLVLVQKYEYLRRRRCSLHVPSPSASFSRENTPLPRIRRRFAGHPPQNP